MKTPDFLNRLPSVNEILEQPRVRSIADRLNRSVAAARARGYLDELATQIKRRTGDAEAGLSEALPRSMRDLVDRVSLYLTRGDQSRVGAVINGTGRLRGGPWQSTPLPDQAIERITLSASVFTSAHEARSAAETATGTADGGVAVEAVRRATGAPGAAVFNSRAGALAAVLASLPHGSEVVVARRELTTLDGGCRVADLIQLAGLHAKEVGAADATTLDDYANAVTGSTAALLRVAADDPDPSGDKRPRVGELAELAKRNDALLIEDVASAPLVTPPTDATHATEAAAAVVGPSAAEAQAAGADIVIVRGDGLLGGPRCAVAIGSARSIEAIRATPHAAIARIEPHVDAALAGCIELVADSERFWFTVPVWSLLTTSLANLQTRAERLAAQLEASPRIAAAEVTPISAAEALPAGLPIRLPTVGVSLVPVNGGAPLQTSLRAGKPALATREHAGKVLIDLRTVFPRQDGEIVEAVSDGNPASAGD